MNVVNRKISEIKPYEKNAKIHDEKQIDRWQQLTGEKAVKL